MGKLKDISWECLKCDSYKSMENCYDCKKITGMYPSWSNITGCMPIIKNIKHFIWNIQYKIEEKRFNDEYISQNETKSMKHVWGIKSYADFSEGEDATLFSMNDFDLTYLKDENRYILGVETLLFFEEKDGDKHYVEEILEQFTKWMNDNGYKTDVRVSLHEVFTEGININTKFKTIEDAYAAFKFMVNGFCNR